MKTKNKRVYCDVCGSEIFLKKEDIYLIYQLSRPFLQREEYYAINCQECGCQKALNKKYPISKQKEVK